MRAYPTVLFLAGEQLSKRQTAGWQCLGEWRLGVGQQWLDDSVPHSHNNSIVDTYWYLKLLCTYTTNRLCLYHSTESYTHTKHNMQATIKHFN